MSDFLDSFLDDEDREVLQARADSELSDMLDDEDRALDLLREDGWTYGEIRDRAHRLDGEYRGVKGELDG